MEFKIIHAKENNWKDFKKIRLSTLKEEPQAFSSTYKETLMWHKNTWMEILRDINNTYLLALEDNDVVGIIRATFNDNEEPNNVGIIGSFYIKSAYRNKGLGLNMMNILIAKISNRKNIELVRLYVKTTQEPAIKLYKKAGFIEVGIKDNELIMAKSLGNTS